MERIKKIFGSLSKSEIRYLKQYLDAFHNKGRNKSLELVELLEKNPRLSQSEMAEKLYGDARSKAFIMMKKRLLEKMQEVLSLSVNVQNNPIFKDNRSSYETIQILKDLTTAQILRRRGLEVIAEELYEKCLRQARNLAAPEYELLALTSLRSMTSRSQEELSKMDQAMEDSLERYEADIQAIGAYSTFHAMTKRHSAFDQEKIDYLKKQTDHLKGLLDRRDSLRARYYYLNLSFQLFSGQNDYEQARKALKELIDLVENSEGLRHKNRLGIPYLRLATLELYQNNHSAARRAAVQAMENFPTNRYNYLQAGICNIFACLYTNELTQAEACLSELAKMFRPESQDPSPNVQIPLDWLTYLNSCLAFLKEDFKQAYFILGDVDKIFADKKGWNIDLRIHEIQILIERNQLDLAASKIETLRKHVEKYSAEDRTKAIQKYLYHLERNSFSFHPTSSDMDAIQEKLEKQLAWHSLNSEVIRFDVWIRSKRKNSHFYPLLLESFTERFPVKS